MSDEMETPEGGAAGSAPGGENGDRRFATAGRVLLGLFVVWASFYLVAIAERISDNRPRKAPAAKGAAPRDDAPAAQTPTAP